MPSKKTAKAKSQPLCACGSPVKYGTPCPDCKNINMPDGGVWIPKVNNVVTLHLPATLYSQLIDLCNWRLGFANVEGTMNVKRLWATLVRQGGSTPTPAYDIGETDPPKKPEFPDNRVKNNEEDINPNKKPGIIFRIACRIRHPFGGWKQSLADAAGEEP